MPALLTCVLDLIDSACMMWMRSRSRTVEKRRSRLRALESHLDDENNPDAMPQNFQVSVNVLEARKLAWAHPQSANSYVIVALGKKKHRTNVRRNMEEPYYREYFMFEVFMSIQELQRTGVWLAVMEPRYCGPPRLLGETTVDLSTVWAKPNHQVCHKWTQLSQPRNPAAGPVGYLKVDIAIIFRGDVQVLPVIVSHEKLEDNLLVPAGLEQQLALYTVTVHAAFGLPNSSTLALHVTEGRYAKPPNTYVKVSFCGLLAKTAVQHRTNHPRYCEQISFVELFPNMAQTVRLEVCSADVMGGRALAATEMQLAHVSHDGENGFLPNFGPSLLHMYGGTGVGPMGATGEDGPFLRGAMLVSLKTAVPYHHQGLRTVTVEPVSYINPDQVWVSEEFIVLCPLLEVSMLDKSIVSKVSGVAITIGNIPTTKRIEAEFMALMADMRSNKQHYTGPMPVMKTVSSYGFLYFPNSFPVLQLATQLPDFRFRMYRNNMVLVIVADLELASDYVDKKLRTYNYGSPSELITELNKALDDATGNIMKYLDIVGHASIFEEPACRMTELDRKLFDLQKEEMKNIYKTLSRRTTTLDITDAIDGEPSPRKEVKYLLNQVKELSQKLKGAVNKCHYGWPDLVVWLLNDGSRVGHTRISAADVIYSAISEQCGRNCGRIQTLYMKPLKCPKHSNTSASGCLCIAGKIELIVWMGLYRQISSFQSFLPHEYEINIHDTNMVLRSTGTLLECRAFIFKGKILNINEESLSSAPTNLFVRVHALNSVIETKDKQTTAAPVWDQVLKMQRVVFASPDRLVNDPPVVLIEVYGNNQNKTVLIGRFETQPVVDPEDRLSYDYAPKLRWNDIHKGLRRTGQVLMSVQMVQVPEQQLRNVMYSTESCPCPITKKPDEALERLPTKLIPKLSMYKVDVYWWGLRDVNITRKPCVSLEIDEFIIKSDVIIDKKSNSNFSNGRISQILESPLLDDCSWPLRVRLYDNSTFGRMLYLGKKVIKNPKKYFVNWLPKREREASLDSASVRSTDFCQIAINQVLVMRNTSKHDDISHASHLMSQNIVMTEASIKRPLWRRFFTGKEPSEEELSLLPCIAKNISDIAKTSEQSFWWQRFYRSLEESSNADNRDIITIYKSELEKQPGFSQFKDWCAKLKLHSGKARNMNEKDDLLHCGFLKAGIAIYEWPPPNNTTPVSLHGVDLTTNYFADHPSNDPEKFIVRIYLVRVCDLDDKFSSGKLNPYVVVKCGKKQLGGPDDHNLPHHGDLILGKMYEFRCTLPDDYLMSVSLYDSDTTPQDELIGSTHIDLENRIYSKHRACVGLPRKYSQSGPNKWRDCNRPSDILDQVCSKNHMPPPMYPDNNSVVINSVEYTNNVPENDYGLAAERKENLCLNILRNWHSVPLCGYRLVPEHVETRSLYNSDAPGMVQGKIQMWVDVFPVSGSGDYSVPHPVNIDSWKNEEFELRVIVWELHVYDDVKMPGHISTVAFKSWIESSDQEQYTDAQPVAGGRARFNWRMVFRFQYQHARQKIVKSEKGPFTEYNEYSIPYYVMQVVDVNKNDVFGAVSLDLTRVPLGARSPEQAALQPERRVSLFSARAQHGWWPLYNIRVDTGKPEQVASVELDLYLLPSSQANRQPVGLGRCGPEPLCQPCAQRSSAETAAQPECQQLVWSPYALMAVVGLLLSAAACTLVYFFYSNCDGCSSAPHHRYKPKHVEGIIRSLYPLREN